MSHGRGKSDRGVVPKKLPNKAAGEAPAAAEVVEGRLRAKGNALAARMSRRSSRVYDVGTALEGIRQTARGRRGAKFAGLLHHIYAVERLRAAYLAVKRDAAAGVDGQTWQSYGRDLEANLLDLSDRLARGGYRPEPVKRAYIDKADGSKRPLGVPALEDKIVQRASAEVLGAIYEQDFIGFSYGFRPGRSAHDALDAVAVGERKKSELDPRRGHRQVLRHDRTRLADQVHRASRGRRARDTADQQMAARGRAGRRAGHAQ